MRSVQFSHGYFCPIPDSVQGRRGGGYDGVGRLQRRRRNAQAHIVSLLCVFIPRVPTPNYSCQRWVDRRSVIHWESIHSPTTELCKKIKNRKPDLASERPSARGRDFAQPIAYLFTHQSIYPKYCMKKLLLNNLKR